MKFSLRLVLIGFFAIFAVSDALAEEIAYTPEMAVVGEAQKELRQQLIDASVLHARARRPAPSELALDKRIQAEKAQLDGLLKSEAYYAAQIDVTRGGGTPAPLIISVTPGPRYTLSGYEIVYADSASILQPPTLDELKLESGMVARAPDLVGGEGTALALLANQAHPLAAVTKRDYVVDHATRQVSATITIDLGPFLTFGAVNWRGVGKTKQQFVDNRIPWQAGDPFTPLKLQEARENLLATEVFSAARLTTPQQTPDGKTLPVTVDLTTRLPRSLGVSAGYSGDLGPGVGVTWENRNLWQGGEKLEVELNGYLEQQKLSGKLRIPDVPDKRTTYFVSGELLNESTDAYDASGLRAETGFERTYSKRWKGSIGVQLLGAEIDNDLVVDLALPVTATYNSTNDALDPTRGWKLVSSVTPHSAILGGTAAYLTLEQRASTYYAFDDKGKTVAAFWAHLGSTLNGDIDNIPSTNRFFAGGGGSVRGYEYRQIGPRDEDDDPSGGTALAEGGFELRQRFNETWGGVVFLEGGSVTDAAIPDFSEPKFGAGVGVRYNTQVGPIRADIGVPLNGDADDSLFQIYVSIGQAF